MQYNTIHLRPVQYNTTYPSKPGSAFEIMYTFYIGINDVPLLVVDFGYFFSSWGWGGVPKFPKVSLFLYIFCSVSVLNLIKSCEKYSVWLLLISLINVLQSSPPLGAIRPDPHGHLTTSQEILWNPHREGLNPHRLFIHTHAHNLDFFYNFLSKGIQFLVW